MKILTVLTILALAIANSFAEDQPAPDDAKKAFDTADAELHKVFKETVTGLDKAQAAALEKKEAAWLKFRDTMSGARAQPAGAKEVEKPKPTAEYWQAMTAYDTHRIEFLHNYSGKNTAPGIYGEFKDAYDGDLTMDETDNKDGILFSLSVVRGSAGYTGQITGIIHMKGNKAYFKGETPTDEKKKPCELVFTFVNGHIITIEEVAPDPEADPGVHYDGDYYKTDNPEKNGRPGNP